MYDLLYDKYAVSPDIPGDASSVDSSDFQKFRWIHCPSNNLTWCQELLLKRFAEQDGADAEGFKAVERSFNYQHRGTRLHAHYMRPMCQIVPQAHREEEAEASDTDSNSSEDVTVESVTETLSPPLKRSRRSSAARSTHKLARKRHARESSDATLRTSESELFPTVALTLSLRRPRLMTIFRATCSCLRLICITKPTNRAETCRMRLNSQEAA